MDSRTDKNDFAAHAALPAPGLLTEFWGLLRRNKKWWLMPIVIVLTILGILVVLGSTSAAPFIYTTW